jgi:SSS family solute:Na+ symporter
MSGAFAAMMAAAVIAHTAAIMNGTVALYAMDFHDKFVAKVKDFWRLAAIVTIVLTISSVLIVPVFENTESIINTLQQLNGFLSMPILSAFVVGLLFRNVESRAAIAGVIWGLVFYGGYNTLTQKGGALEGLLPAWVHYIDMMLVTLVSSIIVALLVNRALGHRAHFVGFRRDPQPVAAQ